MHPLEQSLKSHRTFIVSWDAWIGKNRVCWDFEKPERPHSSPLDWSHSAKNTISIVLGLFLAFLRVLLDQFKKMAVIFITPFLPFVCLIQQFKDVDSDMKKTCQQLWRQCCLMRPLPKRPWIFLWRFLPELLATDLIQQVGTKRRRPKIKQNLRSRTMIE